MDVEELNKFMLLVGILLGIHVQEMFTIIYTGIQLYTSTTKGLEFILPFPIYIVGFQLNVAFE